MRPVNVLLPALLPAFSLLAACSDTQIKVVNDPPTAKILIPTDGDSFVAGQDVLTLHGQVGDEDQAEEDLSVIWLSNRDGELSHAPADESGLTLLNLPADTLTVGSHTLTLSVTDDSGLSAEDTVGVEILPADAPPTVSITSPAADDSFDAGELITFTGEASDARTAPEDLIYEWESDVDGVLDSGTLSSEGGTTFSTSLDEGDYNFTLRVTDTDGYAATSSVHFTVNHVNEAPSASIVAPTNGSGQRVGSTVTFEGLVADLEDLGPDLDVVWSSDIDGTLWSSVADSAGETTFSTAGLSIGIHTITLDVTDPEGDSANAAISFEIYEKNEAPSSPNVEIDPSDPVTTDALVVIVVTSSVDPEGDTVSYNYQWYKDSALMSGYTTDTVAASKTKKGEIWMVEVTPTDGEDSGAAASATVTVLNTPPSISAVSLTPTAPTTLDTLTCTPSGWSDADGDAEAYTYSWTVHGVTASGTDSTLSGAFAKNQVVICTATPWDGEDAGSPVSSSPVTIRNAPPVAPEISIDPEYPVTDDDLVVVDDVAASDADGDALTTTYVWSKNGTVKSSYTTDTIPNSATTLEDEWSVYVIVDDGDDTDISGVVTVRIWPDAGDLIVTEIMPDPDAVSDQRGEWVEITNVSSKDISLDDHWIQDLDYDHAALDGLTIASGDTIVICVEDDSTQNGGVTCDIEVRRPSYGNCSGTDCMLLGNSDDEVYIENLAGVTDGVVYTSAWVNAGKATGLDPDLYDDVSNDSKASWCAQTTAIMSGGDKGTPGSSNDGC